MDCRKCKVKEECNDLIDMGFYDMTCEEVVKYAQVGSEVEIDNEPNTKRD